MTKVTSLLAITSALLAGLAILASNSRSEGQFIIDPLPSTIIADGHTNVLLRVAPKGRQLRFETLKVAIIDGQNRASLDSTRLEAGVVETRVRPGILPGRVVVEFQADGFVPARIEFTTLPLTSDALADGMPDFLRLNPEDDLAFRNWSTYLAESQSYRLPTRLAKEINDCAALLRFAYREALREHDARWANDLDIDEAMSFPSVQKYRYPYTPLGAALFRTTNGAFRPENLIDGTFTEFADAHTLQRFNTHFISRDVSAARPGDLFFYRQLDQNLPFHAMVFLGPSHFESDPSPRVVYHTGPIGNANGEIRRPTLDALLRHPEPKWRPVRANSSFLGVYRWNILR